MIKAVLFDVDGTLISLDVIVDAIQHVCERRSLRVLSRDEIYKKIVGHTLSGGIRNAVDMTEKQAEEFNKDYIKHYSEHHVSKLFPNVLGTVQVLKDRKIKIGVVTTKGRETAMRTMRDINIPYDVIVTADDVKKIKPDPEPMIAACKALDVNPENVIMVGDHVFDIKSAKSAGCIAVGVTTGVGSKDELIKAGADFVFSDVKEILKVIQ